MMMEEMTEDVYSDFRACSRLDRGTRRVVCLDRIHLTCAVQLFLQQVILGKDESRRRDWTESSAYSRPAKSSRPSWARRGGR
jgi:hypothetical protein